MEQPIPTEVKVMSQARRQQKHKVYPLMIIGLMLIFWIILSPMTASTVSAVDPCCDGKVTWLELRYLGPQDAYIVVTKYWKNKVVFAGVVISGETFIVKNPNGNYPLGYEISIYVNKSFNTKIKTNCMKN